MEHGISVRPLPDLKRAANEILYASAKDGDPALPYFCECEDLECLRPVWLERAAYERLRSSSRPLVARHEHAVAS